MIYIDPPYNTGSDSFIYPDKFSESREEYARRVGDKDAEGYLKRDGVFQGAWRKNSKDSGHYHSNWLSMMLPRLHLARTLLRDDGVIFISIDDNEQAQLKLLCDEVFGAENFVADFIWNNKYTVSNDTDVSYQHEHIICYTKNRDIFSLALLPRTEKQDASYKNRDNDPKGAWKATPIHARSGTANSLYEIEFPNGIRWSAPQGRYPRYSKHRLLELFYEGALYFNKNGGVDKKTYLSEVRGGVTCGTVWSYEEVGHSHGNNEELAEIMEKGVFSDPKGINLLKKILWLSKLGNNNIVLDFFSGSATTAHAAMLFNIENPDKEWRYICIQLAEPVTEKESKAAYDFCQSLGVPPNIAEIAKKRIRRAGEQISGSLKDDQSVDTGFKVFKLAESNFKTWEPQPRGETENWIDKMEKHIDNIADGATSENMVYELMLRLGCKLTSTVQNKNSVYWVTDEDTGKRIALLLEQINQTLIEEVIAAAPAKVVALDKLFDGNDALKSNTVLQMKDTGIVFECV